MSHAQGICAPRPLAMQSPPSSDAASPKVGAGVAPPPPLLFVASPPAPPVPMGQSGSIEAPWRWQVPSSYQPLTSHTSPLPWVAVTCSATQLATPSVRVEAVTTGRPMSRALPLECTATGSGPLSPDTGIAPPESLLQMFAPLALVSVMNRPATGKVRVGVDVFALLKGSEVSRADLADVAVAQLTSNELVGHAAAIAD